LGLIGVGFKINKNNFCADENILKDKFSEVTKFNKFLNFLNRYLKYT